MASTQIPRISVAPAWFTPRRSRWAASYVSNPIDKLACSDSPSDPTKKCSPPLSPPFWRRNSERVCQWERGIGSAENGQCHNVFLPPPTFISINLPISSFPVDLNTSKSTHSLTKGRYSICLVFYLSKVPHSSHMYFSGRGDLLQLFFDTLLNSMTLPT